MGTLDANAADSQDSNQVETGKSHVRVVTEIVGLVAVLLPVAGAAILLFRYRLAGVPDAQKYALLTSLPELSALGLAAAIPFLLLLPIASNLQRDVAARRKMISKQREYLRKLSGSEAANETLDPEEIETYRRVAELNIDVASGDVMPDSREAFTVLEDAADVLRIDSPPVRRRRYLFGRALSLRRVMSWAWWIIPVVFALVYPTAVALITLPGAVLFTWLAKRAINRSVREDRALDVSLAWPMIVVGLVLTIAVGGVFPLASPPSAVTTAVSAVPSGEYYVLGVESGFVALLPCDAATDVVHEVNTSRVTSITSRSNNVGIDDLFRYSVLNTLFGPNTIDQMLTMGPFCEK